MLTELIFGISKAEVGLVQFDAMVSETHTDECEVTDHPVELGSDIADHIRKRPVSLELNGIVSNTPLVFLASVLGTSPVKDKITKLPSKIPSHDRVGDAYSELRRVMDAGETMTVITTLRQYSNMAITSLSVTRDAANGNVLNCTISLREIILAMPLGAGLPIPEVVANQAPANQGNVSKETADPSQEQSGLSKALEGIQALVGG